MKIQTNALLKSCSIDGIDVELPDSSTVDLEFSAIDTGGGFRDAILDFSINIPDPEGVNVASQDDESEIVATIQNPDEPEREVTFAYQAELAVNDDREVEINGRLKEDQLSREIIGFILHLLQ